MCSNINLKYDVIQVTAEDLDGDDTDDGRVSYSIRGGDGLGSFIIDEEGNIRSAIDFSKL